jgi:hypothetical protein
MNRQRMQNRSRMFIHHLAGFVVCTTLFSLVGVAGEEKKESKSLPMLTFSSAEYRAKEGSGVCEITVKLSHSVRSEVSFEFATRDNTAVGGEDYETVLKVVSFPPRKKKLTINIPIIDDKKAENDETFQLFLSDLNGAAQKKGSDRATVIIRDND